MAEVRVTSGVDVACPAERAWAVVSDFARNPEWQGGMRSCEWLTAPPLRAGSRYEQEASFLGRTITTTFEVVALEPGRSVTIDSRESSFPLTVTRSVTALDEDHCRIAADVRGTPNGLMGLAGPLLRRMVKRSVDADYRRLRVLLEGSGAAAS